MNFESTVFLPSIHNIIKVKYKADSIMLRVKNLPPKLKLNLISFGPRVDHLSYNCKDAKEFCDLYSNQSGPSFLFSSIVKKEITYNEGTRDNLLQEIKTLKNQNLDSSNLIMLFISSHGETLNDSFYILTHSEKNNDCSAKINLKTEILDILNTIKCKKIIFLDACFSALAIRNCNSMTSVSVATPKARPVSYAKSIPRPPLLELNRLINDAIRGKNDINIIASSNDDQQSYESPSLENGYFTSAVLEGLSKNYADQKNTNNSNAVGVTTLRELYDYLYTEVPLLIKRYPPDNNGGKFNQTPQKSNDNLFDMPIYINEN